MAYKKEKKILCGIYGIHNKLEDKYYIGQATNIVLRFKQHRLLLRKNEHSNKKLQDAWNKYGEIAFELLCLKECCNNDLNNNEQIQIKKYDSIKNGYNNQNAKRTNEKISRGYYFDKEVIERLEKISKQTGYDKSKLVQQGLEIVLTNLENKLKNKLENQ